MGMEAMKVDFKLPHWDGDWATYSDYVLRVELRADATKPEDLHANLGATVSGQFSQPGI